MVAHSTGSDVLRVTADADRGANFVRAVDADPGAPERVFLCLDDVSLYASRRYCGAVLPQDPPRWLFYPHNGPREPDDVDTILADVAAGTEIVKGRHPEFDALVDALFLGRADAPGLIVEWLVAHAAEYPKAAASALSVHKLPVYFHFGY